MSSNHKQANTFIRLALILVALTVFAAIFYQKTKNGTDSTPVTLESPETEPAEVGENKEEQNRVVDISKESAIEDTTEKDVQKDVVIEVSPTPPFVETIRVEADGAVVLAGRTDPNAEIKILLDEAVINSVRADASGNFVALFDIGMSAEIRVMSLLAIVDNIEVYAEEDIIISASKSARTTLADEEVVAKADTDFGDETMESQEAETSSEEKSPKKTILKTKTEEVAEVSEKTSGTQAEQKKDLAESETNNAASSENESVASTDVKTTSLEEETKHPVAKIDDAVASLTKIITTETETADKVDAKADETGTAEQEKVVVSTEKYELMESQEAETSSEEKLPKKAIMETKTEEVAEVSEKTSGTQAGQKKDLAETETKTAASLENESLKSTGVKTRSLEEETKHPVAQIDDAAASRTNIFTTENETAGKVDAKADETGTTEQEKVVTSTEKDGSGEKSQQKDKTLTVTTDHDKSVAGTSVSVAEKNDVSAMVEAETVTLQTEIQPESIITEKQADNEAPSVKKTVEEDAEEDRVEEELLVVIAGNDSVKVVQSPKKGKVKDVSVDAISYDETGDVALTGRGNPSQMVRIYLDNMPVSTAAMDATGQWRTALSEIDAGVYTLRVDELDSKGNVVSRLETPFKREKREDLAAYMIQVDEPARINVVTVQPGNTLWAIARERYGQGVLYVRVFEENKDKIRDPDLIYPGQVFSLPDD